MLRRTITARALLIAGAGLAALIAAPSFAQEAVTDEQQAQAANDEATAVEDVSDVEGDIVVTARRRDERLRDVPIAVTAYTGEQLEAHGAIDITDIADTTPNVTLEPSRATNSTLTAFIRGVGQQDPVAGFEQGVGIYLDDVYLNRPQAAVLDIYDVERIEVLRGPQGTLYGRNTIGGAIKYVTRRLTDNPEVRARATYGTYDQAELVVSASAPVAPGLRVGVAGARLSRGGFGDNLTTGLENYNKDIWAARGTIELEPSPSLFVRLSGDYTHDKSDPRGGHRLIPGLASGAPVLSDVYDTRGGLTDPEQDVQAWGVTLLGEVKPTDWLTIRSITAYRADDSSTPIDFDALPAVDLDVPGRYNNDQFSQEVQLLLDAGRLNGLLGVYYLDADADTPFDVRLFTTVPGLTAFTDASVRTRTTAIFADFTYDFTERLSLSLGGRYTWDRRYADILRQNYLGGGSPEFGGAGIPFGAPSTDFRGNRDFNKFTPRASLRFKPTPEQTVYASYSRGFKGGGFDPRGVGANAPDTNGNGVVDQSEVADFLGFDPETVDSYEVGYKSALFDNRLNLALAAFYADYKDVQIPGSAGCTVAGLPTFCGVVTNAGKARFKGLEAEANARLARDMAIPGDALTLAGTLGYIDPEFREYVTNIPGQGPVDVAPYRKIQNTPRWTASGTLNYSTPLGSGDLGFNTTLSYRSKTYQFEIPVPQFDQDGYALLDASLVYHAAGDRWSIGLHGKNLTDKQYKTSGYNFTAADPVTGVQLRDANGNLIPTLGKEGVLTAFYGAPRQVFVTFGVRF